MQSPQLGEQLFRNAYISVSGNQLTIGMPSGPITVELRGQELTAMSQIWNRSLIGHSTAHPLASETPAAPPTVRAKSTKRRKRRTKEQIAADAAKVGAQPTAEIPKKRGPKPKAQKTMTAGAS